MKIIGLTGGIGSGKSTVSRFLGELGAVILSADEIGHEAIRPGSQLWQQVVNAFGKQIIGADGAIDRKKLGRLVFGDAEDRGRLNHLMHPAMYDMAKAKLEEYRRRGVKVAVLEAPLLLEAGWTSLVDEVWVTTAPEATVIGRLKERGGLSEEESLARIGSQMTSKERIKHADVIIDTDCDLDELEARVKELWHGLQAKQ